MDSKSSVFRVRVHRRSFKGEIEHEINVGLPLQGGDVCKLDETLIGTDLSNGRDAN